MASVFGGFASTAATSAAVAAARTADDRRRRNRRILRRQYRQVDQGDRRRHADPVQGFEVHQELYLELMALLFDILNKVRKEGLMSIEGDIDAPEQSPLFSKYPGVLADHHIIEFITDYLRLMVSGNMDAFQIENLMDNEIETHHHEGEVPGARASPSWATACRPSVSSPP
jgi:hypothetical protein